jgi:hypothetical protein
MVKMKKLVLVLATLPLSSCFSVDDFGAYWKKAGIDKRLAGSWKETKVSQESLYGLGPEVRFVAKGDAYEMSLVVEGQTSSVPAKTLNVGRYQFLANRPDHPIRPDDAVGPDGRPQGRLQRYKVNSHVLELCDSKLNEFVRTHFPHAVNFTQGSDGDYMEIGLFDDEVFTILSAIPDTATYWTCNAKYARVP